MQAFLQVIANAYAARYSDLSEMTFVFPSKRSGTFFRKYLQDTCSSHPIVSPEITTVSELVSELSGHDIDNRVDLLFTLYDVYCESMPDLDEAELPSFEKFAAWGEVALRDFSETDMYGIDAAQLFRNVAEYKKIASSFLTEEQVEVLREYFDMDYLPPDPSKFWTRHYSDDSAASEIKQKFRTLWESLGPLYERFAERLDEQGLTTTGGAYRRAVACIERDGLEAYPTRKFVFIGFNVLSKMEFLLFKRLGSLVTETEHGREPYADFIWDLTGPMLKDGSPGARLIYRNLKIFPKPAWLDLSPCESDKAPEDITVIAAPSNTLQVKIAGQIAADWNKEDANKPLFESAKVALVLPDENLLLQLLYSIPEEVESVNLTMGYPLRLTSTMSFIDRIKRLQLHRTSISGTPAFFHEDVMLILSHPFAQSLLGMRRVADLRRDITDNRRFAVTPKRIAEVCGRDDNVARLLFTLIDPEAHPAEVITWLNEVLEAVEDSFSRSEHALISGKLDRGHIDVYRDALRRLGDTISRHKVRPKYTTVLSMADRLLAGEDVRFEGKPLQGLQVMGLLETRALDFEYLIIPSMNEKIMPRRMRRKSFIPEVIRKGFGMPSSGYEESIFAYYFYRLLARAKRVVLLYDARTGEGKGGDVSRYVLQLRHLYPDINIKRQAYVFNLRQGVRHRMTVKKDEYTKKRLELMATKDSDSHLSASTLYNYCECPLKFYFKAIAGISDDTGPTEFMDDLTIGTVFHGVMEDIYKLGKSGLHKDVHGEVIQDPMVVTKEHIERYLKEDARVLEMITSHVNKEFNRLRDDDRKRPLRGEPALTAKKIHSWVKKTLRKDLQYAPFTILGTEFRGTEQLEVPQLDGSTRRINFAFSIDRVDRVNIKGVDTLRIVDYKTGKAHLKAASPDEIFDGTFEAKNILQPLLYAHLYNLKMHGPQCCLDEQPLRPEIYSMIKGDNLYTPKIAVSGYEQEIEQSVADILGHDDPERVEDIISRLTEKPAYGDGNVTRHTDIAPLFLPRLYELINEIFDLEKQFVSTDNDATCRFCPYIAICRKK